MLTLTIFLPLAVGLLVLLLPKGRAALARWTALAGALGTLGLALVLLFGYDPGGAALQWRTTAAWIPGLNASYDVAVDGLSLPLIVLTAVLLTTMCVYVLPRREEKPHMHAFLFLLMTTGLIGLFAAQDLLLFYLFFEIGLVPMYFIVGMWGHENRRYAALKFFLYTRAGSLAMLLSFLALYLAADPHTFSLPALTQAQPLAGAGPVGGLVLLGMLIGFGVKLPAVPLHNWLPDAHVEAPTEGSVMLAGIQLKMGAYGLLRVMLPTVPEAAAAWGWGIVVLAVVALVYGALAALAQTDLKRLVAYTSINHMGYVLLGAGAWALSGSESVRQLALSGATYQMVSHGLLTGGMFFMVGMLQDRASTREMERFGGLLGKVPVFAGLMGLLIFGSLGLPGFSGFIAEFQVIGAAVSVDLWVALLTILGLVITTGLYLKVVTGVLMGEAPGEMPALSEMSGRELIAVGSLTALALLLGILPGLLTSVIEPTTRMLAALGL
jgi:NADH-quinone oxidoreductase subunit M